MILGDVLPKNKNINFKMINKILTKKEVSNIIDNVYRHCGQKETVLFADKIMQIGLNTLLLLVFHLVKMILLYLMISKI